MKTFIKKNKFFVSLLSIALLIIASLSVYIIQKNYWHDATIPSQEEENPPVDSNKPAEITALSVRYTRSALGISGNVITVSWAYSENASKVIGVNLYLNDNAPINVTTNSYYDFTQGAFDYTTGENKVRLQLQLENGEVIEKEKTVFVQYIISTKQEVSLEGTTLKVTLEYVYSTANPVEIPEILIANSDSDIPPMVTYVDTQTKTSGNKVTARTTYALAWRDATAMANKINLRWKFNVIQDSFDYVVTKP